MWPRPMHGHTAVGPVKFSYLILKGIPPLMDSENDTALPIQATGASAIIHFFPFLWYEKDGHGSFVSPNVT